MNIIKEFGIQKQVSIQPNLPISIPRGNNNEYLLFHSDSFVKDLSQDIKPERIKLDLRSVDKPIDYERSGLVQMPDLGFIRKSIIQGAFIQFYEFNKPPEKLLNWSEKWKFAWLIRNAFAHGGVVNWTDDRICEVSWDSFSFTRSTDNGREIIFNNFGEADIIILLTQL